MNEISVLLALAGLACPAFAQANDDCAGAISVVSGSAVAFDTTMATDSPEIWPCGFGGGADLWYTYTTAMPNADIRIETCGSGYDTTLEVFTGTCLALVSEECNDDDCGLQSGIGITNVAIGTTYFFRVGGFSGASGTGTLLLTETVVVDPCDTPDVFESNIDCTTATPLSDGTYVGLNVESSDHDYYSVILPAGGTLNVDLFFEDDDGDVDLYLWDPLVECDTNVVGTMGAFLERAISQSDDEAITWINTTGADQDLIIEVNVFGAPVCNAYDMVIMGSAMGNGSIGSSYCMPNPNSTGVPGNIVLMGSSVVADNDVTATASNLPIDAFGFFITSTDQNFVANPGGSSGNLCVGGAIGRYVGPGQIMSSGNTGEISLGIDLTMIPSPTGFVVAAPGDNWNYQLWYRDTNAMGATSNFTQGFSVTYQ